MKTGKHKIDLNKKIINKKIRIPMVIRTRSILV